HGLSRGRARRRPPVLRRDCRPYLPARSRARHPPLPSRPADGPALQQTGTRPSISADIKQFLAEHAKSAEKYPRLSEISLRSLCALRETFLLARGQQTGHEVHRIALLASDLGKGFVIAREPAQLDNARAGRRRSLRTGEKTAGNLQCFLRPVYAHQQVDQHLRWKSPHRLRIGILR